jgi:protein-tyrosine phosphatase
MKDSRRVASVAGRRRVSRFQLTGWTDSSLGILDELLRGGDEGRFMDMSWVTGRIAVGGGIWNAENMAAVAKAGVTHIIDMQIEFDDRPLAAPFGVNVLWNPVDDDFQPKPPEVFERGVDFAKKALDDPAAKLFIHCAAGVHRAPMMALGLLGALGFKMKEAMRMIETRRPQADFADVYVRSVERFLQGYLATKK